MLCFSTRPIVLSPSADGGGAPSPKGPEPDPVGLREKVAFLRSPATYPEAPAAVEARETHMSWVFLTHAFAWKLKKPVVHLFLDYRRVARRRFFCEEEIRLNRRLAPAVYLDAVPLARRPNASLRRCTWDASGTSWR